MTRISGAYTYSTDSDLQAFLDLQAGAVVYDGFLVNAVADSGESYNQVLVFDLQKLGISAPTIDTLVEGNEVNSFSGTLQTEGLYAGSTGTFEIEGGSGTGTLVKAGTYGQLTLNASTGAFTYELGSTDAAADNFNQVLKDLSGVDLVNDQFTVSVSDGGGGFAETTLTFNVQGYGITVDDIATDNQINLAESEAGTTISGTTYPGQELEVSFSSGRTLEAGANTVTTDDTDGTWSFDVSTADIEAFGEGSETVTATVTIRETFEPISVTVNGRGQILFDGALVNEDFTH